MIQRMANPATSKLKVQPDIIYMNMSTLIRWYMRNCVSSPVSLCNDDRRWYFGFKRTRSSNDECSTGSNNYLRSTDLFRPQIIEFNISKNLVDTPHPPFFYLSRSLEVVWMSFETYSSSFVLLSFCVSVSLSMLNLSKVPIDGHIVGLTRICRFSPRIQ